MARNLDHNKVQRIETPYGNGYYYNGRLYSDQDFKNFAEGGDIDEESESSKKSAKAKPGDAGYVPNKSNRDYGTKPTPKFELRKKATTTSDQPAATTTPEATPAPKYTKEYVDMVYTGKNRGDVSYTSMWQSDPEFQRLYDQYNQPSIPVTSQSSNVSQAAQNASAISSSDANEYGSDPYLESISKGGGQESVPTVNLTKMNLSGYAPDENSPEAKAMAQAQVQQGLAAYQRSTASTGNTGAAPVASTPAAKKTVAMTPSTPSVAPSLLDQQSSGWRNRTIVDTEDINRDAYYYASDPFRSYARYSAKDEFTDKFSDTNAAFQPSEYGSDYLKNPNVNPNQNQRTNRPSPQNPAPASNQKTAFFKGNNFPILNDEKGSYFIHKSGNQLPERYDVKSDQYGTYYVGRNGLKNYAGK